MNEYTQRSLGYISLPFTSFYNELSRIGRLKHTYLVLCVIIRDRYISFFGIQNQIQYTTLKRNAMKLLVRNLARQTTEIEMRKLFEEFGEVGECHPCSGPRNWPVKRLWLCIYA